MVQLDRPRRPQRVHPGRGRAVSGVGDGDVERSDQVKIRIVYTDNKTDELVDVESIRYNEATVMIKCNENKTAIVPYFNFFTLTIEEG